MEDLWRNRVATLNLKNFPDLLYERLQELARRERRSLGGRAAASRP
jgi:hypothetical protein